MVNPIQSKYAVPLIFGEVAGIYVDVINWNTGRNQQRKKFGSRHDVWLQPKKRSDYPIHHGNRCSGVTIGPGHKPVVEFGATNRCSIGVEVRNKLWNGDFLFA